MNTQYHITTTGQMPVSRVGKEIYVDIPSRNWDITPSKTEQEEDAASEVENICDNISETIQITDKVYRSLGRQIAEYINDQADTFISSFECEFEEGDKVHRLVLSAFVSYDDRMAPDGQWREIADVVPVWCELHTYEGDDMDERRNDFSFAKLNKSIIENQ